MKVTEETVETEPNELLTTPRRSERRRHSIRRLEFLHEFLIDSTRNIPSYYIVEGNHHKVKVRIGISFELTRNRKIRDYAKGRLFCPIVVKEGLIGNQFSINAPFILDTLRSCLAPQDEFNILLLKEAAAFTATLFRNVLLHRFGPLAYLLLKEVSASNVEIYLETLYDLIQSRQCILNNEYVQGSKIDEEHMFCTDERYLPCRIVKRNGVKHYYPAKDLYGFISDSICVTREIEDADLLGLLVSKLGVKAFTIHDVISLKSNDYIRKNTPFQGWHYTKEEIFNTKMIQKDTQLKYADAISNHFSELTDNEKDNLKASYSWLSASGNLRPLSGKDQLFQWTGPTPEFPGFDIGDVIHQCISNHPLMKKLRVTPYDVNKSLLSATIPKLKRGELDEAKKTKLLDFLIDNASKLSAQVIKELKAHPLFLDDGGRLVEFSRLVRASKRQKKIFGDSISIPSKKLLKSKIFLKRFRIRRKINDDDILRRVEQLSQVQDTPNADDVLLFEAYLNRRKISSRLVSRLKELFKIVCSDNTCANPQSERIYYDSKKMRNLVGDGVVYAKGNFKSLFRKLDVRFRPVSEDIINFIAKLRETSLPPQNRSLLYTELTKALTRDGKGLRDYQAEKIINIAEIYHKPKDVFLKKEFRSVLLDSKVYLKPRGKKLFQALIDLGCKLQPLDEDYIDFLKWVSMRLPNCTQENLKKRWISLIHLAYSNLSSVDGIELADRIILTHNDQMVSRKEVAEKHVYLDDDPQLSRKIKANGIPIWFVNCGLEGYDFMEALEVPKLSDSVALKRKSIEGVQTATSRATDLLSKLKSIEVINATLSMVQQNDEWRKNLNENWAETIEDSKVVKSAESIEKTFGIGQYEFSINSGCCLDEETVYFLKNLEPPQMRDMLAIETSKMVLRTKHHQASLADAIYRFLEGDITHYLNSRGYIYQRSLEKPEPVPTPTRPLTGTISQPEKPQVATPKPGQEIESKFGLESEEDEEEKEVRVEILTPDSVETPPSTGWRGKGPKPAERFRTADISYNWIIRIEECDDPQCSASNISDMDLGYDIEVTKDNEITKMIEVKSTSNSTFPVQITMTPNEWRKAKEDRDHFWLYIVRDVRKENKDIGTEEIKNRVKKFHDPYELFKDIARFEKKTVTLYEKRVIIKLDTSISSW